MRVAARGAPAGNAVTEWNLIAVNTLWSSRASGRSTAGSQVNLAMVQGAVYDAVNAIEPKHRRPYLLDEPLRLDGLEGCRRGDRGIPRPLEYRLDGAGAFRSRPGRPAAGARHGV